MIKYLAGAAALAMAVGTAYADPGKGNGGDKGNGNANHAAAKASPGNGNGNGKSAAKGKGNGNGNAGAKQAAKDNRGNGNSAKVASRQNGAGNGNGNANGRANGSPAKNAQKVRANPVRTANGNGNGNSGNANNSRVIRDVRDIRDAAYRDIDRRYDRDNAYTFSTRRGVIEGCPPGLAKKRNGCNPPGLVKDRYDDYRPRYFGLRDLRDGRYYYGDGYLYRLGAGNAISGYIPLLGGALSIGNTWPSYYDPSPLPSYYVDYYNLGPSGGYRYADDVIYRVDPETAAITSIAAMLTGDNFAIGQPMPSGYDVYNVPYSYRDRYYDTPQARYRYSDGYIYQVDPTTQLIVAAINMLT